MLNEILQSWNSSRSTEYQVQKSTPLPGILHRGVIPQLGEPFEIESPPGLMSLDVIETCCGYTVLLALANLPLLKRLRNFVVKPVVLVLHSSSPGSMTGIIPTEYSPPSHIN